MTKATVTISDGQARAITEFARTAGVSFSEMLRRLLDVGLAREHRSQQVVGLEELQAQVARLVQVVERQGGRD